MSRKLNDMFTAAGLDTEGIHNHSLRATGISRLYNCGVPEKLIMERSGHLSVSSVHSYERTSNLQRKEVSSIIAKPLKDMNAGLQSSSEMFLPAAGEKVCSGLGNLFSDKENFFDIKDLHGCTININFGK